MIKRTFDLIFAMLFLFLTLVPMSVIAMLIIIDSKGSIIHKSKRVGMNNKIFNMYKFKSLLSYKPAVSKISNASWYFLVANNKSAFLIIRLDE